MVSMMKNYKRYSKSLRGMVNRSNDVKLKGCSVYRNSLFLMEELVLWSLPRYIATIHQMVVFIIFKFLIL
jgi:hypothetical protein